MYETFRVKIIFSASLLAAALWCAVVWQQTLLRVWDCFLVEGPKVLFRISTAVLQRHRDTLIKQRDTLGVLRHLKSCTEIMFDADQLIKVTTTTTSH